MSSASTSSKRGGFKIRPLYQPLSDRRPSLGLLGGNGYKNRRFDPKYYGLLLLLLPFFYLLLRSGSPTIPFHHPLGEPYGNTTFAPTLARQIPPYVHYVFGLSPTFGGKSFAFIHYVCLSSALVILKPEVIYMHYVYEPTGWWWEQYKERVAKSGTTRLQMVKQRDVTSVFGNSIEHFAHKADVLRLEVLRDYGGIYLDSDVMVIKDLAPLYRHEAVMAMESQPNLDPALPPSGLCNAVVLAKPYSSFIELTVLNKFAFFWPIWHDDHLRIIHRGTSYNFHKADSLAPTYDTQFTYHLWESVAWERYLSPYDPDRIHNRGAKKGAEREEDGASDESSFSRFARQFVGEEFRIAWRQAVKDGLV